MTHLLLSVPLAGAALALVAVCARDAHRAGMDRLRRAAIPRDTVTPEGPPTPHTTGA